jgi:hypothetical protein
MGDRDVDRAVAVNRVAVIPVSPLFGFVIAVRFWYIWAAWEER